MDGMDGIAGIAGVQARIQRIVARFGVAPARGALGADAAGETGAFASLLDRASASAGVPGTGAPNAAGVDPVRFAHDFLARLGMPRSAENVRAIIAWQQAEGTRARFNPLATTQPWPGATNFNSVGVKNFASYEDGLAANVDVIRNGRYENILAALRRGTSAEEVARAIADGPWGTGDLVLRILREQRA
jgi:hypothetical protein